MTPEQRAENIVNPDHDLYAAIVRAIKEASTEACDAALLEAAKAQCPFCKREPYSDYRLLLTDEVYHHQRVNEFGVVVWNSPCKASEIHRLRVKEGV